MITAREPMGELDPRFSTPDATPAPWRDAQQILEKAEIYWISTVRPDGRPHVTPLAAIWMDGAMHFCTGPTERKARNLEGNRQVILTTGNNSISEGMDVVVEGTVEHVTDEPTLQRLADGWVAKYGEVFRFDVRDHAFHSGDGGKALVFRIAMTKAFGFGKGDRFSQTRWRF